MLALFPAETRNALGALGQQAHLRPGRNILQKFGNDVVDTLLNHGAKLGQKLTRSGVQFGVRGVLRKGRVSRRFCCFEYFCLRRHASSSE